MSPFSLRLPSLITGRAILCGLLVLGGGLAAGAAETSKEYQIKAAFLYNFTKFVEWPAARFADDEAPIVIGVLGENPFGDELENVVRNRRVNNRDLVIRRVGNLTEAAGVHLLFIGFGGGRDLEAFVAKKVGGVLTVGESERFCAKGGMVNFVTVNEKVRFEINIMAAEERGLKVSAQLQKLATVIHRKR